MGLFDLFKRKNAAEPMKPGAIREAMMFAGRARLITHLMDEYGEEGSSELSFDAKPPGFDPLLVFEFAPWRDRAWWTYSTAGLSICPAMDRHAPTELVAYSRSRAQGLVDLLFQLSFKDDSGLSFRPGDIVSFADEPPNLGVPLGRHYGLDAAPEKEHVTQFPDLARRPEDQRFVLARPGEDSTRVQFLRVVGLVDGDFNRWNELRDDVRAAHEWQLF